MKVKYVQTFWGLPELFSFNAGIWKSTFQRIKESGYSALEIAIDFTPKEAIPFIVESAKELDFDIITQIHTCTYPIQSPSVSQHLDSLQASIVKAKAFNPKLINCHSGCDYWSKEQSLEFFKKAQEISNVEGIEISHETHRSRALFNPWITKEILKEIPEMKVTADLSHWVVACERIFNPQFDGFWEETLDLVSKRTPLIHARVGTSQTPQILDVNLPEFKAEVEEFEKWWLQIYTASKGIQKTLYVEPEYGPDPYMPKAPFTCHPLADIWKVRENSMERLKKILN